MLGDEPLLSISHRFAIENEQRDSSVSGLSAGATPTADNPQWPHNSTCGELDSRLSQEQFEGMDLEKDLLNQQCGELREELAVKERDLDVLREELLKTEEELEEARSRYV